MAKKTNTSKASDFCRVCGELLSAEELQRDSGMCIEHEVEYYGEVPVNEDAAYLPEINPSYENTQRL